MKTKQLSTSQLIINGVRFAPISGMSGVQNFFADGWPHHKWLAKIGLVPNFDGATFVAKTTTLFAREGNMPLDSNLMPKERFPKCIHVSPFSQRVVNAVSLSGVGYEQLLDRGIWQKRRTPFFISFMSVAGSRDERLKEAQQFVEITLRRKREFQTQFGVQSNESCPNTGDHKPDTSEIDIRLDVFKALRDAGIPCSWKFGLDTEPETVMEFEEHDACDAVCIPNTIPFGKNIGEHKFPWRWWYWFGSPLLRRGLKGFPGGLSGPPLRPLSLRWTSRLRELGFKKHINAGGGINRPEHVDEFKSAGADSCAIGSVAITRPWRVRGIIERAHQVFGES